MKKQVIAYLHTHWDREWYREYEVFRLRLLKVFDNVLEMLDGGKIPSFYFDGQTAALQDYLEMRPENEERVRKLIKEKKLFIGPFYCLVDEFLTNRRCFEKNLEIGLKYAREMGCEDFVGYLADTFGHSKNVIPVLKEFGIDKVVVWRGCGDFPTEFIWNGMNTLNLVRGYFMDYFSTPWNIEKKAEAIKDTLDKLAEKSGDVILLPIGADHLGVEKDIAEQIKAVNELLDNYEIRLGSPFEYFDAVKDNFKFKWDDELRDNSRTFVLPGCYSSRLDLKRYNSICYEKLALVEKIAAPQYASVIEYAYILLLKNQAHDGICGCSTDAVHRENKMRYEKILQIADTILKEMKFDSGAEFESIEKRDDCQLISTRMGFEDAILFDTQRIPITEDYREIYTYLKEITPSDDVLQVCDNELKNSFITLKVDGGKIFVGDVALDFINFKDFGDSYNYGPVEDDKGVAAIVKGSKVLMKGDLRCGLRIETTFFDVDVYLDKGSEQLDFRIEWDNKEKNHIVQARFELKEPLSKTVSRDMGEMIERTFDPNYDIRKNLPKTRGIEAKTNTAPMQDFVSAQGLEISTIGLTEYEVFKKYLMITLLRATGRISNPKNSSRSTPAGPPLVTPELQMLGKNVAEFSVKVAKNNFT